MLDVHWISQLAGMMEDGKEMYKVYVYTTIGPRQVEAKEFCSLELVFDFLRTKEPVYYVTIKRISNE